LQALFKKYNHDLRKTKISFEDIKLNKTGVIALKVGNKAEEAQQGDQKEFRFEIKAQEGDTIVLAATSWMGIARIVRGEVMRLKHSEYVLAAETIGASTKRIIFKHLIPNTMGPIIVQMTMMVPAIALSLTMLGFNIFGDGLRDALDPKLRK
jgi:ABC-type antimicrobial peptide transport system permease subunit